MSDKAKQSQRSHRKDEHLALAKAYYHENIGVDNDFDAFFLLRPTLPETKVDSKIIETKFLGTNVSAPFFINAMTGGSKKSKQINHDLGSVAGKHHIPIALGSASILAYEPALIDSFVSVRDQNPDGPVLGNINPDTPIETIQFLVQEIKPIALQIHINAVQELLMPEGDRDFHWLNKLLKIKSAIDIPVIIKEVGFGFDLASLKLLEKNGFEYVDVAGSGGTDFGWIENFRRPGRNYDYLINSNIGISTVQSLINAQQTKLTYFASGGIRNPLDVLKSMVLGAKSVGISNQFLQILNEKGAIGLDETIHTWKIQLAELMALFGANNLTEIKDIQYKINQNI